MSPVPVGFDPNDVVAFLQEMRDEVMELRQPTQPQAVFAILQASLPSAADWRNCLVLVTDLNVLAHSDGSNWIRSDTGAAI